MDSVLPEIFPFFQIADTELLEIYSQNLNRSGSPINYFNVNPDLKQLIDNIFSNVNNKGELDLMFSSIDDLNNLFVTPQASNNRLKLFHVNVRSLNCDYIKLVEFISALNFEFEVIILSEIWRFSLQTFTNLLQNYSFFSSLPMGI